MGHLIPAGTGFHSHRSVDIEFTVEEPEPIVKEVEGQEGAPEGDDPTATPTPESEAPTETPKDETPKADLPVADALTDELSSPDEEVKESA